MKYPEAKLDPSLKNMDVPELTQFVRDAEIREANDQYFAAVNEKDYETSKAILTANPDLETYWKRNDTPLEAAWHIRQKEFNAGWEMLRPLGDRAASLPKGAARNAAWDLYFSTQKKIAAALTKLPAQEFIGDIMLEYPDRWTPEQLAVALKGKVIPGFDDQYGDKDEKKTSSGGYAPRAPQPTKAVPLKMEKATPLQMAKATALIPSKSTALTPSKSIGLAPAKATPLQMQKGQPLQMARSQGLQMAQPPPNLYVPNTKAVGLEVRGNVQERALRAAPPPTRSIYAPYR